MTTPEDRLALSRVHKTISITKQTKQIDDEKFIRVSNKLKDNKLINFWFDNVQTLYDVFMKGIEISGDKPYLGTRNVAGKLGNKNATYEFLTYNQVFQRAENFGSGLISLANIRPGLAVNELLGIYAKNMTEWVLTEKAATLYNICLVPMYNTLGDQAMRFIVNQTELRIMIIEASSLHDFERDVLTHNEGKTIGTIILIGFDENKNHNEIKKSVENRGIRVFTFEEVENHGALPKNKQPHSKPNLHDVTTISYTSGTTGDPKGVMLTHANFVVDASNSHYMLPRPVRKSDCWFSYLPLPHVFERTVQVAFCMMGARVGFYSGDLKNMPADLSALKPTVFGGVPRIWTRFYDKITTAGRGSWFKTFLLNQALKSKVKMAEKGIVKNNTFWDKIVFKKVTALLGGKVEICMTGAAPISPNILNVLRAAFGTYVIEGYGQTECAACACGSLPGDHSGVVGIPMNCNEIRLDDVPEMDYFAKDGKGEICIRGMNVMKGYYKNSQKTAETIDEDNWLHTGDIGMWTTNGSMKIIDRKKNIFKLSQGEYIAPEKIENIYIRSGAVSQIYVHGDSLQSQLVAIVVPDPDNFIAWCFEKNLISGSIKEATVRKLCEDEKVKKAVLSDMVGLGKASKLKGFEQAKILYLEPEPWTVEQGLLTPTFKTKRPQLSKHYKDEIEFMYRQLNS